MLINRIIFEKLLSQKDSRAISILIGARQVGKSTLLSQLQKNFKQSCRYINLENPLHLNIFSDGYTSFMNEVPEDIIFIDEFHYYSNMTSVFKSVYDLCPNKKIYASGSSSLEMHQHLKESLAGRKTQNNIYPLSFAEWLSQYNIYIPEEGEYLPLEKKNTLDKYLDEFLTYGALPGLIHIKGDIEKREYLFNIYQTYISKDIKSFLKEESILSFNKMIEYMTINNTCQLNMNTLSRVSGVSVRQATKQFEVMQGTYVLGVLRPFYNNKNKEITKNPKTYFYDQGVANVITTDFRGKDKRNDGGAILEQFVYWEIIKSLDVRFSLKYWRTADKNEVDFILEKDKELLPIEVKRNWDVSRVPNGIKAFFRYYPEIRKAVILTDCQQKEILYKGVVIYFRPWYKAFEVKNLI